MVSVSGPEARAFLQGLITNDVKSIAPGHLVYAALLTPQGKILFDFLICEGEGGLLIDCRREAKDALLKRLSLYKLRAKVDIKARDDLDAAASAAAEGRDRVTPLVARKGRASYLGERSAGHQDPGATSTTILFESLRDALRAG